MKERCHVQYLNLNLKNKMSKETIQGRFDAIKGKNSIESRPIAVTPTASNGGGKDSGEVIKGIDSRPISPQQPSTGGSQSSGNTQANPAPQQGSTSKPQK